MAVHAFDVLGDPVRRRILEILAEGEKTSGAVCAVIQEEFGISQPAVSQHLRVLREGGFTTVRPEGVRRLYAVNSEPLREVDALQFAGVLAGRVIVEGVVDVHRRVAGPGVTRCLHRGIASAHCDGKAPRRRRLIPAGLY